MAASVPASLALDQQAEIVRLQTEVKRLRRALTRARDTFADTEKTMRMLNRPIVAEAMSVALQDASEVLGE